MKWSAKDFDTAITKLLKPTIKNNKYELKQLLFSKVITYKCKDAKQRNYKDTSSDFKETLTYI